MAKTVFVNGSLVEPSWFNAIQSLNFRGEDFDGSYPAITNDDLSSAAGQIKPEWTTFRDLLKISAGTGTTVSYTGGSVAARDGSLVTIAPGVLALPTDGSHFVFLDRNGAISSGTTRPTYGVPLARVTTVAGQISGAIEDLRPRFEVKPRADLIRVFGGLGGDGAYNLTSGTASLDGEKSYTSFTIAAGATLNCSQPLYIRVAGNVVIDGTINMTACVRGGQRHFGNYRPGTIPGFGGAGFAGATGVNDVAPSTYSYFISPLGSGGCGGLVGVTAIADFEGTRGGNGGSALIIEATGTISVTGTINCNGGNGDGATVVKGAGGGAVPAGLEVCTGGSGGSGGLIWLKSLISVTAGGTTTLSVRGGSGGLGYPSVSSQTAGGGGGGYVVCEAPVVNLTGANILLTGGASGTAVGFGSVPGASFGGQGGAAGQAGGVGQLITRIASPL